MIFDDSSYDCFGKFKEDVKKSKYVEEIVLYLGSDEITDAQRQSFWSMFCEYFLTYSSSTPIEKSKFRIKINNIINSGPLANKYMYLSSRAILEIFENNKAFVN